MALSELAPGRMTRTAMRLQPRAGVIALLAALFFAAAFWRGSDALAFGLWMVGGTLLALAALVPVLVVLFRWRHRRAQRIVSDVVASDAAACFVTDEQGELWYLNDAAKKLFQGRAPTMAGLLSDVFSSPLAVLQRLRRKAEKTGAAREDIATRKGTIRLATHRLGGGDYLWRIEEIGPRVSPGAGPGFVPMLTVGRNGTVLYMNEAARQLMGTRIKSLDGVFPDRPAVPFAVNRVATAEGLVPCYVAQHDIAGGRREMALLPSAADAGTVAEPGEAGDIGDTTVASDLETLPVPLLRVAPQGRVLASNRLARDLLGREDCNGLHLATLMEGLGRSFGDWLGEVATGRETKSSEFLRVARDDREVFVQVLLKRASDPGATSLVAVLNDATELKTLEAQFVQSQKMQAIGQLAGGVAHDFNNLLTAISGHCDLLLLRHDQGDPDFNDLVQINQNANRAAALVNQLLAFSRKQTQQLEILDLRDTLSDLTHLLNRLVGEKVSLSLHHDPRLQAIRADKRQLEQVVMNLVVNARDAMPEGGQVRIETRNLRHDRPVRRDQATVPAGDYVSIEVRDQGSGIAPDMLEKIFEPFYTTKRVGEGTGLGLSTAYGIVKQTGGFIFADSEPGTGTCFTLLFPVYRDDPDVADAPGPGPGTDLDRTAAAEPAPAGPVGRARRDGGAPTEAAVILLVEDEAPVRAFAARALRLRGHSVLEAGSAEEALKLLEDGELRVDVFITDVVMPGMDGPSWVREALKSRPDVRVVFVSGYAEDAFGEGRDDIPNSVFLPKPFSLSELTETIRLQLQQGAAVPRPPSNPHPGQP